jgi:gamma-glutamyltranspeptidase/glutathione hydrolase
MAVSVPGTIAGLHLAEKRFGKLGWARVCEPAIKLAADGYTVYEGLPENIARFSETTDSESVEALFPGRKIPQVGETWIQSDLAKLIEVLAADPESIYTGEVARRIVERVRSAGGILTEQDMADYRCEITEPMSLEYRGVTLHAPVGVTGSPCTFEALAILQQLSDSARDADAPGYWGDFADALTLAWRDRIAFHGDVPGIMDKFHELMSDAHARELAEMVRAGKVRSPGGGIDPLKETIHLTTCDSERNMVSLTQTHGGGWGTRFGIPGLGIVIGHGMSRFDPRPGLPNSPGP